MITRYKAADPLDPTSQAEYKLLAAGAQRYWHGTRAAFEQVKNSIPNNTMICITDDNDAPVCIPDWDNAVPITAAQLVSGYTCPGSGMVVGTFLNSSGDSSLTVNNVVIASGTSTMNVSVQVVVNKDDILKNSMSVSASNLSFIPFI